MNEIHSSPTQSFDSNLRQTSAAADYGETFDSEAFTSRRISREVATNEIDDRILVDSDIKNSYDNGTTVTDDDFSYYMQKKVSNSSHFKLFTFVEVNDSIKSPYYTCHNNNNNTLHNMKSLPSHEIKFSYSVEYDKTNLTQDEMIEIVENKMTSIVANYLLSCGHNSTTQNDSSLSIARLRISDAATENDDVIIDGTGIIAIFSTPKDTLLEPCTENGNTNVSLCVIDGTMSFILSVDTSNITSDVTSTFELVAVMEAISNMNREKTFRSIQSINYIGPPLRHAQISSYHNAGNRLAIIVTVILIPLCGIAIIFFFSKIFANDQRQAAAVARGIIQRKSIEHHETDSDEGQCIDDQDSAENVDPIQHPGSHEVLTSTVDRKLCVIVEENSVDLRSSSAHSSAFS